MSFSSINFGKKSGIVMTEALMAVSLMIMAVMITGGIIETTVSTTKQTRDYSIAQNLSGEAVEAVRNIINSNKIVFAHDPNCWIAIDEDCNKPDDLNFYIVKLVGGKWKLESSDKTDFSLTGTSGGEEVFRLALDEKTVGEDSYPMYLHNGSDQAKDSNYFRAIKFIDIGDESASFLVQVKWKDGSLIRSISNNYTVYR
jgi:hypothetical protein